MGFLYMDYSSTACHVMTNLRKNREKLQITLPKKSHCEFAIAGGGRRLNRFSHDRSVRK